MKEIKDLKQIQQMSLEILKKFDYFCKKNGLTYFLDFGTLLGAVQFKGFIPWDDDIDVSMPRPDYEKFLCLTKGKLSEIYSVLSTEFSEDYVFPFAKVIDNRTVLEEEGTKKKYKFGVYIDVFPIDGVPNNKVASEYHIKKIDKLIGGLIKSKSTLKGRTVIRTIGKLILYTPFKLISPNKFAKKIEKMALKYPFDECEFITVAVWVGGHKRGVIVKKEDYLEKIKISFEGKEFYCPGNFDEYLTLLYGNYKQLPPKEKRVSHHKFNLYRL